MQMRGLPRGGSDYDFTTVGERERWFGFSGVGLALFNLWACSVLLNGGDG